MTRRLLAALILAAAAVTAAYGAEPADWHLLTQTYGGIVSINGGLTAEQCERLRKQLVYVPGCPDGESVCEGFVLPAQIMQAECFR